MTVKEIDNLARKKADFIVEAGKEVKATGKPLTLLQVGLYYYLRQVYDSFDNKEITADEAKAEKERIIKAYEADEAALSEYDRLIQQNGEMLQQLELHRKIFEQDDKRRVAISGLMCKANKNGCEICKQIARFYDGRNEV